MEEKILEEILKKYKNNLKQKLNYEIIVSDGGSTDATVDIAKKYADKLVINDLGRKQTIAEGRNLGAAVAESTTLIFINGDSYPHDTDFFLKFVYDWSTHNGEYLEYKALACPVSIAENEIILKDKIFYFLHNNYVRLLNIIGIGMGRGECQFVKRVVFDKVAGYNSNLAAGEDFDLYRRLIKHTKIGFAKEVLIIESPRRYREFGYLRIIWIWIKNALMVMFKGKSDSKEWKPVR